MSKAASKVKIVLAGAGLIGRRHANLVHNEEKFDLIAIIDPTKDSEHLCASLHCEHFISLKAFLASNTPCDGIIIATPNETHKGLVLECIKHSLPCLIEKPLAVNAKQAKEIVDAIQMCNTPVLVGHHRRHHAIVHETKRLLHDGKLGKIVAAQTTWMLRKPDAYFQQGEWRKASGGGPIWINLIHEIDMLRYLLGEIVEVSAFTSNKVQMTNVEDTSSILFRFQSGVLATVIISDATPSPWHFEGSTGENPNIAHTGQDGLRIFGTKGAVEFPSLRNWSHSNQDGHWGDEIFQVAKASNNQNMNGEFALRAQLFHFAEVISKAEIPIVTANDGMENIRVAEAIMQSAKSRKHVSIN